MRSNLTSRLIVGAVLIASAAPALADIQSKPVQFAKGASSTTVKDSLQGDQTIDYELRARAGQTMTVTLQTSNGANYFNVLPPERKGASRIRSHHALSGTRTCKPGRAGLR